MEEDVFELELMEEVKTGHLAHLIVDSVPLSPLDLFKKFNTKVDMALTTSRSSLGLADPYRVMIITKHRCESRLIRSRTVGYSKGEGNLLPRPLVDLFTLKPILFADMDPKNDQVYEGFAIKLTFIEDAITGKLEKMRTATLNEFSFTIFRKIRKRKTNLDSVAR